MALRSRSCASFVEGIILSDPPPAPDSSPTPPNDPAHDQDGFDIARVLRVAVVVAALVSAFAAAHGILMTIQHLAADVPAGTIARVEPGRGGYRVTLDGGRAGTVPS